VTLHSELVLNLVAFVLRSDIFDTSGSGSQLDFQRFCVDENAGFKVTLHQPTQSAVTNIESHECFEFMVDHCYVNWRQHRPIDGTGYVSDVGKDSPKGSFGGWVCSASPRLPRFGKAEVMSQGYNTESSGESDGIDFVMFCLDSPLLSPIW
jgi:hypothetical protein